VLASAAAVAPRHQLDGGSPYQVTGMIADPVRHRLWMTVAGDRSRGGLWCHSPRDGNWRRVLVGDVRGPYWDGGRTALVTWSQYSQALAYAVDLDGGGCTPLLGFVPQDRSHADPAGAGQALFDGLLFTGPGRLLDADGAWYEPEPAGPSWTRIEQVGDVLVACDLDRGLLQRIRRRGAVRPPDDGRRGGRGDAKLRAAVAALGSDVPQERLAGLKNYRECRTAIDWLVSENGRRVRYLGDEEFARILLDGSRPAEQMAAIDVIRRLDLLRRFDAEVLRRLAASGPREVAAAATGQLARFGTNMTYLVEYPEAEARSDDPLQRAHAVEQIGREALVVPKALPVLVRMLDDPVDFVALAAVVELDPYGDESLPPILDAAARVAARGDGRLALRMLAHRLAADDRPADDAATLARIKDRLAAASNAPDVALAAAAGRAAAAVPTIEKQLATPAGSGP
jgi:hypothetical protein